MNTNIESAISAVLTFLKEVPLSASTVNLYRISYITIHKFCHHNGFTIFSENEAETFIKFQQDRLEKGEIGPRHFARLRRAATILMNYLTDRVLKWEHLKFNQRWLSGSYETVIQKFEYHLAQSFAPKTILRLLSVARQFLFFWKNSAYKISKA